MTRISNITWLNQGGFLFEVGGIRLIVDAYVSNVVEQKDKLTRLVSTPLTLNELRPDYWLCTHDHLDHLDPPTVETAIKEYPQCKFIGPASVQRHLTQLGLSDDKFLPLGKGESVKLDDLELFGLPAIHSDPYAIGVLLHESDFKIYLSGDTEFFEDVQMQAKLPQAVDVVLICINGKYGNMNWREAVEMVKLIKPRLAVPMHYGLFAENTVSPNDFLKTCRRVGVNSKVLQSGQSYNLEELLK